jgi:hypothetical protein
MTDSEKPKTSPEVDLLSTTSPGPLVFISHDARDADLAEAFSKLLKSVSAGMIKTFRSSDKKGTEGIDFGDEWYKRLMAKLQSTSDVVCLFTERSLDRPWILFEAGVAKGKLSTPVVGVALGVPLSRVSAGPFYQFNNMDDSEADLTKLVHQLARRVPSLELDSDVVKVQVATFKTTEAAILKTLTAGTGKKAPEEADDSAVAKLVEEMKALPSRVAERLAESGDPFRRRKFRRFHPMMFEDLVHMSGEPVTRSRSSWRQASSEMTPLGSMSLRWKFIGPSSLGIWRPSNAKWRDFAIFRNLQCAGLLWRNLDLAGKNPTCS